MLRCRDLPCTPGEHPVDARSPRPRTRSGHPAQHSDRDHTQQFLFDGLPPHCQAAGGERAGSTVQHWAHTSIAALGSPSGEADPARKATTTCPIFACTWHRGGNGCDCHPLVRNGGTCVCVLLVLHDLEFCFFSECDNVGARCPLGACTTHGSVVVTSTLFCCYGLVYLLDSW
jgi:hypothetical protein